MAGAALAGLIAGIAIGWNARQATGAHSEIRSGLARIPRFRKARFRSGITTLAIALAVIAVLANSGHK